MKKSKSFFLNLSFFFKWLILSVILFLFLFFSSFYYVKSVSSNISSKIFRLHIVANSDSPSDQMLKLKVRDEILNYMNSIIDDSMSKNEIIDIANNNIDEFKSIAIHTLNEYGCNKNVAIDIGRYFFPTKRYGNIYFPDGVYDSLNIKIGDANGHNWWCVMFPPLCFVDTQSAVLSDESMNYLKNNLTDEDINVISEENNSYILKFKTIELLNNLLHKNKQ